MFTLMSDQTTELDGHIVLSQPTHIHGVHYQSSPPASVSNLNLTKFLNAPARFLHRHIWARFRVPLKKEKEKKEGERTIG